MEVGAISPVIRSVVARCRIRTGETRRDQISDDPEAVERARNAVLEVAKIDAVRKLQGRGLQEECEG